MCGGNIRADREYTGEKVFTYAMLKGEAPFENNMIVVVKLPGYVLASAVKYSRQYALGANPTPKGMFLQVDDGITVDPENNVLTIAGKPIDLEKKYSVALNHQVRGDTRTSLRQFLLGFFLTVPIPHHSFTVLYPYT